MTIAAIILAAGRGRRFGAGEGASKLLAELDGTPLVRRVATTALASRAAPVVVVTGHAAPAVEAALADLQVFIARNPAYAAGLAGSLAAGLAAIGRDAAGALILLADMPRVAAATLDRLIATFEAAPLGTEAIVPVCEGRPGNPALIAASLFGALQALRGDEGARGLLAAPCRKLVRCPVDDPGILIDIDSREALVRLAKDPL